MKIGECFSFPVPSQSPLPLGASRRSSCSIPFGCRRGTCKSASAKFQTFFSFQMCCTLLWLSGCGVPCPLLEFTPLQMRYSAILLQWFFAYPQPQPISFSPLSWNLGIFILPGQLLKANYHSHKASMQLFLAAYISVPQFTTLCQYFCLSITWENHTKEDAIWELVPRSSGDK